MIRRCLNLAFVICGLVNAACAEPDSTGVARAESTLRRALDAMAARQTNGGWAMDWSVDGRVYWGEWKPIPHDWITVQPPATPDIAGVFLRAASLLQDDTYRARAGMARDALEAVQTPEGGFPYEGPVTGTKVKMASFDDNVTTGALYYLIDYWHATGAEEDKALVLRTGDFLLVSQQPCGGWTQTYPVPDKGYQGCITFNDGAMARITRALLRLHKETGEARFLEGARHAGDCIIAFQGGPGEEVWAQQYDPHTLKPAPARMFEHAGYSAAESGEICDVLVDLYLETGEARFLEPLPKAFAWYEAHRLPNGQWARVYETGTARPVYGRRDTAEPIYDLAQACTGYAWQGDWFPARAKARYEAILRDGRDAVVAAESQRQGKKSAPSSERIAALCDSLTAAGDWVSEPDEFAIECYRHEGIEDNPLMVRSGDFVENTKRLMDYIEAARAR